MAAFHPAGRSRVVLGVVVLVALPVAASPQDALSVLPAPATVRLTQSLEAAARHARSLWRDVPPVNEDGTVNAYVEISRGDVQTAHAFFGKCRERAGQPCQVNR